MQSWDDHPYAWLRELGLGVLIALLLLWGIFGAPL